MTSKISDLLKNYGMKDGMLDYFSYAILIVIIILSCIMVNIITKNIILKLLAKLIYRNRYHWDKILLQRNVFSRIANLFPGIIVYLFSPAFEGFTSYIRRGCAIYISAVILFVVSALLNAIDDIYRNYPISKVRPIKGLLQVVKIVFYIVVGIVIIGILMDQNPLLMLGGIGALAAVFSFVFKDSILGFIAGIQLTSNDMLRIGDWIEMPKYGADGDVIDITLNTVKVQNFDKTIVTLPAYSLVSDSFKNWRGMTEFGGRRIKRSVIIDVTSIQFCSPEMIEKFKRINYLKDYITTKESELKNYNKKYSADQELDINKKRLTNIGTFRVYIENYLRDNPQLQQGLTMVVRQLPQGENGLPLEILAFTDDTRFENFERIQSDIFDHIFSIAGEFELRVFQSPTGYDYRAGKEM
ncbi:MAG: putative rane protein [Firmicutes bacterium]|nr:putative rane protein [Bacillota bacterium]